VLKFWSSAETFGIVAVADTLILGCAALVLRWLCGRIPKWRSGWGFIAALMAGQYFGVTLDLLINRYDGPSYRDIPSLPLLGPLFQALASGALAIGLHLLARLATGSQRLLSVAYWIHAADFMLARRIGIVSNLPIPHFRLIALILAVFGVVVFLHPLWPARRGEDMRFRFPQFRVWLMSFPNIAVAGLLCWLLSRWLPNLAPWLFFLVAWSNLAVYYLIAALRQGDESGD
jgi:hypothetical protein